MPHITDTQSILRENLLDAGCGKKLTEQVMSLFQQGKTAEGLALLAKHRKYLLDCCHTEEKKIDCLDYLVHRMEKEVKANH